MSNTPIYANDHLLTGSACGCRGCGEIFSGERSFNRHRLGSPDARRCMTSVEMLATGLEKNGSGKWRIPRR